MRAARRDDNEAAIVRALKQAGASVERLYEGGGVPDLLVGWCQKMFILEVKGPKGKLTRAQVKFRARWKGPHPITVRDPHEALCAIGAFGFYRKER